MSYFDGEKVDNLNFSLRKGRVVSSNNENALIDKNNSIEKVEIIGHLYIPKINLNTDILSYTSDENLEISVTRLCGPKIVNTQGNLCISGHNYFKSDMFGNLYKLNINDKIYISSLDGNSSLEYTIYDIYTTSPDDISCIYPNGNGDKEVTLITCTITGLNRLIVKAKN